MGQGFDEHHCTNIAFFGQNWQQLCGMGDSMLFFFGRSVTDILYLMQKSVFFGRNTINLTFRDFGWM